MTPAIKKMILKILKDTYNKIENDTCGLDEDEILSLANTLTHIKLNIDQTCKYINCSRATLHRMIIDGRNLIKKLEVKNIGIKMNLMII